MVPLFPPANTCSVPLLVSFQMLFYINQPTPCYGPTPGTTHSTDLVNFSLFLILSDCFRLQTVRRFSMRTHLSHTLHTLTNTCLPHGKPYAIKLNSILDSSFPCCAWLCCHTHVHHTCSMLLFHSATTMQLHHVINSCYACPKQYQ